MKRNGDDEKRRAHELIDRLEPKQASAVIGLLESILDPVSRAIANAPMDDEPVTAEEGEALNQSRRWIKHNQPIPHAKILAELGIAHEEIERFMKSIEPDRLDRTT
jgi:hypothetical protein